jgi:hypothetical protein
MVAHLISGHRDRDVQRIVFEANWYQLMLTRKRLRHESDDCGVDIVTAKIHHGQSEEAGEFACQDLVIKYAHRNEHLAQLATRLGLFEQRSVELILGYEFLLEQ